ncbi:hypothetical protein PoB_002569400 [Plakobranchus ocellatus]|uniref:Uncharacterized protein n=1 Tax=Plakobranchus ocellatus TaxID=259542 RepID=A0AAV3ZZ23_9GAST|nr:hypothetical protein PoB_002569400 [Plakobranchus ocellatus]
MFSLFVCLSGSRINTISCTIADNPERKKRKKQDQQNKVIGFKIGRVALPSQPVPQRDAPTDQNNTRIFVSLAARLERDRDSRRLGLTRKLLRGPDETPGFIRTGRHNASISGAVLPVTERRTGIERRLPSIFMSRARAESHPSSEGAKEREIT